MSVGTSRVETNRLLQHLQCLLITSHLDQGHAQVDSEIDRRRVDLDAALIVFCRFLQ